MDLLIKHGTWAVILIIPGLAFLYLNVSSKLYPFLVARGLQEEDVRERRRQVAPAKPSAATPAARRKVTVP